MGAICRLFLAALVVSALSAVVLGQATSFQPLGTDPSCPAPPNEVWYNTANNLYSSCLPSSSGWLYQRFSQSIDFDRYPGGGYILKNWRGKSAALRQNITNTQGVIACVGDSLTGGNGIFVPGWCSNSFMYHMWAKYGFGGSGWISSGGGIANISPPGTSSSLGNGWSVKINGDSSGCGGFTYGPDDAIACGTYSGTGNGTNSVSFTCGSVSTLPCTQMTVYIILPPSLGSVTGAFNCEVDGNASGACTSTANASNTTSNFTSLTLASANNLSATVSHTLTIAINSAYDTATGGGNAYVAGVDSIYSRNGVRIEKLGSPSERAYDRDQIPPALFESELNSLGIGTYIDQFSTNEQNARNTKNITRTPSQYGQLNGDMDTLAQEELAATPLADIIVATDPDTAGVYTDGGFGVGNNCGPSNNAACSPIAQYAELLSDVAHYRQYGFVNVYQLFHPWTSLCTTGSSGWTLCTSGLGYYVAGDGKHLNSVGWDMLSMFYEAYLLDSMEPSFKWVSVATPASNALNPFQVVKNGTVEYAVNSNGIPGIVAGNATAGNGVPAIVYDAASSKTAANIAEASILTVPSGGAQYDIVAEMAQADTGSGCSGSPGSVTLQFSWTDLASGITIPETNVIGHASNGTAFGAALTITASGIGSGNIWFSLPITISAAGGTAIKYQTTLYTPPTCTTTNPKYQVFWSVKQINNPGT